MNDTLKVARRIGAELGAAKAEVARLRGLLRELRDITSEYAWDADLEARVDAALPQQPEPECRCSMRERLVGDGCSICNPELAAELEDDEPAPAQQEREAPQVVATAILGGLFHGGSGPELGEIDIEVCTPALEAIQCETVDGSDDVFLPLMTVAQHERIVAALTRPVQTEQQPERSGLAQDEQSPEQMLSREQIENIARKVHGDCIRLPGAAYQHAAEAAVMYTLERIARPAEAEGELADRMRAAGMMTIEEMLAGAPLDRFMKHAGVSDLETYSLWLDMKCREFLTMQAERDLDKEPEDDMYEWVLAHAAVFQEARINFNAARDAHIAALSAVTAERDRLGFALQRTEQARAEWEENAELLEKQRDAADKAADTYRAECDQLRAEVEALRQSRAVDLFMTRAEADALRKDAERVNWLAEQFKTCTVFMSGQHPWRPSSYKLRELNGPTFRDAVDAAMAAKEA